MCASRPPAAMAFAPPLPIPPGAAASTVAPPRCLRRPWRWPPLPTPLAAPRTARAGFVPSAAVSRTRPPPAVVLLPGMDGTALLGGHFRSALDPLISLVVRLPDSFFSGPSLRQRGRDGHGSHFLLFFFPWLLLWREYAWVLTSIGRSGSLGVKPLYVLVLFLSQEASYPCDELLDTAQLAGRVVPTFAAQAREMHPTGRYVIVAQSFSGHGTSRGGGSLFPWLSRLGACLSPPFRGLRGRVH